MKDTYSYLLIPCSNAAICHNHYPSVDKRRCDWENYYKNKDESLEFDSRNISCPQYSWLKIMLCYNLSNSLSSRCVLLIKDTSWYYGEHARINCFSFTILFTSLIQSKFAKQKPDILYMRFQNKLISCHISLPTQMARSFEVVKY